MFEGASIHVYLHEQERVNFNFTRSIVTNLLLLNNLEDFYAVFLKGIDVQKHLFSVSVGIPSSKSGATSKNSMEFVSDKR